MKVGQHCKHRVVCIDSAAPVTPVVALRSMNGVVTSALFLKMRTSALVWPAMK